MSDRLKPGDLLEIKRKLGYSHWALYIGDDRVIHFNCPPENPWYCVLFCRHKGKVEVADLKKVTEGFEWSINNSKDEKFRALPDVEITQRGKAVAEIYQKGETLPKSIEYNILFFNCETFCSYCRYGVKQSDQVEIGTFIVVKLLVFSVVIVSKELHKKENDAVRDDSCRKQNGPHCETTILLDEVGKFVQFLGDVIKMLTSWERTGEVVSFVGRCIELGLDAWKENDFLKHLLKIVNELHTGHIQKWISNAAVKACSAFCSFLGCGLQMFGCVLKNNPFTAGIGDKMDKIGCILKKWGTTGITDTIVSICGWALDLTLEQKKQLAAGVDSVLLVLNKWPKNQLELLLFLIAVFLLVWKHRDVFSEMSTSISEMEWIQQLISLFKV